MIVDRIENAAQYEGISPRMAQALEYLKKTDFTKLEPGKHELDGTNLFALIQHPTTRPKKGAKFEAHRRYIDVQYVFEGVEQMGYAPVNALKVMEEYDPAKEALFLKGKASFVTVSKGMFVVFWPDDAHIPCVAIKEPQPVKKVVVKVLV